MTISNIHYRTTEPATPTAHADKPDAHVKPKRGLVRGNLNRSLGDGASFGAMVGLGETYLPAFALALGMGETASGLVASLPVVAGGIMQMISLQALRWLKSEHRWVVLCALVQALSLFPLVAAALYGTHSLALLLVIASVYWGAGLASGPAWNTWMESVVPPKIRANYFANRTRVQQMATLLGLVVGGSLLELSKPGGWLLNGFAVIFGIAALCRIGSVVCLSLQRTDPRLQSRTGVVKSTVQATAKPDRSGSSLLVYLVAVQACVQVSGPFFAPYMLEHLGMNYYGFVVLLATAFVSRIVALRLWGKLADDYGAASLFWLGAIGLVPLSALWIVSSNFYWLLVFQFLSGVAWAAYELGFFLLFFETLPRHERTKMLTIYNLANTLAMFAGAMLGAALLNAFGCTPEAYFTLFGISSIGRLLALALLWRTDLKPVPIRSVAIRVLGIRPATATLDVPILPSMEPAKSVDS